jgi:disulfide oxidoreductase YuzD
LNIFGPESEYIIEAKITRKRENRNIIYSFVDSLNHYFFSRKKLLLTQIAACKKLLYELASLEDKFLIDSEIQGLDSSIK